MRTKFIAGNWKMNTSLADAHTLATGVLNGAEHMERIEIVLCPPAIWLTEVAHLIPPRRLPHLKLGAQNMYFHEEGAFTGEISPLMVKEVAEYVILGHSERVHIFKEDPHLIAEKAAAAVRNGLTPILCVGEKEQSADSKRQVVHQLNHLVKEIAKEYLPRIVVAYEPVWAIGTGNPATPEYAEEVMAILRSVLTEETRILYGGSVTEENAEGFLKQENCDGFLVGGASLKLKSFLRICQIADDLAQYMGHGSVHHQLR